MTTTADYARTDELTAKANRHLWGHFARHGMGIEPPIITRGEGVHIYDSYGKRYFDGLSGLFTCQVGHGRKELGEAAAKQAETLEFCRCGRMPPNPPSTWPSAWPTTPPVT